MSMAAIHVGSAVMLESGQGDVKLPVQPTTYREWAIARCRNVFRLRAVIPPLTETADTSRHQYRRPLM